MNLSTAKLFRCVFIVWKSIKEPQRVEPSLGGGFQSIFTRKHAQRMLWKWHNCTRLRGCTVGDDVMAAPTYVHTSRESREKWIWIYKTSFPICRAHVSHWATGVRDASCPIEPCQVSMIWLRISETIFQMSLSPLPRRNFPEINPLASYCWRSRNLLSRCCWMNLLRSGKRRIGSMIIQKPWIRRR